MTDPAYFEKVYREAVELTAYLCRQFNLDPHGTVMYKGVKAPVILCHADSHNIGLGGNHGDVLHWFPRFGKNMQTVRRAARYGSVPLCAVDGQGMKNKQNDINQSAKRTKL